MTKLKLADSAIRKAKSALKASELITDDPMVISSLEHAIETLEIRRQEIITGIPYGTFFED